MKILAIETSCDETAISIIKASGRHKSPAFKILASVVHSQAALHAEWLGVVPNLAKREHALNLVPVLKKAVGDAGMLRYQTSYSLIRTNKRIRQIEEAKKKLEREPGLAEKFLEFVPNIETPEIDLVAVTYGPGLEPALWTGINFAKALGLIWNKPIIPINHMEGHILSVLLPEVAVGPETKAKLDMPAIALLISGGHTELVLIKDWLKYKVIGHTRDDAVGEAFDKVARMLGLPYPGGPEISRLAEGWQGNPDASVGAGKTFKLPRPMINSGDLDFSFSGLKTAVLYTIKKIGNLSDEQNIELAHEFEEAVVEVLVSKTKQALEKYPVKTLIIGGGVIANKKIRGAFKNLISEKHKKVKLLIPHSSLATDNAVMIAIAGYFRWLNYKKKKTGLKKNITAKGNLVLR